MSFFMEGYINVLYVAGRTRLINIENLPISDSLISFSATVKDTVEVSWISRLRKLDDDEN